MIDLNIARIQDWATPTTRAGYHAVVRSRRVHFRSGETCTLYAGPDGLTCGPPYCGQRGLFDFGIIGMDPGEDRIGGAWRRVYFDHPRPGFVHMHRPHAPIGTIAEWECHDTHSLLDTLNLPPP